MVLDGNETRTYLLIAYLHEGANVVSLGFDPDHAPIVQRLPPSRNVPKSVEKKMQSLGFDPFPLPENLVDQPQAQEVWKKLNAVLRSYAVSLRLTRWLLEEDRVDYEQHSLADGTAVSNIGAFRATKVPLNLIAGKAAVLMGIPQTKLETQIQQKTGFSYDEFKRATNQYQAKWKQRYPERVKKVAGKIELDRVVIRSHALAPSTVVDLVNDSAAKGTLTMSTTIGDVDPAPTLTLDAPTLLRTLGRRAYGRDLTQDELTSLLSIYQQTNEELQSEREALRDALIGLLVSPPFLLRYTDPRPQVVDDHEIARRLARFLWLSIPDDELLRLADRGQLSGVSSQLANKVDRKQEAYATLHTQLDRLIADEKFDAVAQLFISQWLNLDTLSSLELLPAKIKTPTVEAMRREPVELFLHIIRNNRPLTELVEADYTFVNDSLALHYDIEGVESRSMQLVHLDNDRRGGLLGMAAMQAVTSTPERTSPVTRGAWIVEQILGERLPAAPDSVPELKTENKARTVREELELHREATQCAGCHRRIDPFGFVLENYDQFGKWRSEERGKPIDSSTELPDGTQVSSLSDFRSYLREKRRDDIVRNICERILEFALGRRLTYSDEATVQRILIEVKSDGYRARTLVRAIVTSEPFLKQNTRE